MFKTNYKVIINDINYGGHMGNQVPLILFQQVRLEFLDSLELSELNIGDGIGIIQRESWIKYNKEIFFNEKLILKILDIEIDRLSLLIKYNIYKENGENAVEGTTTMLAYDYNKKKVTRVPESFKVALEKYKNKEK
ncbi:MAG: acyl-CoA thioesterase [Fusobacteriaceae bacterium]